jgi:hypothetical protein
MMGVFLQKGIFEMIGKLGDGKEQADAIYTALKLAGVKSLNRKKLDKKSKKLDEFGVKKWSFGGGEAQYIATVWNHLIKIIYPEDTRQTNKPAFDFLTRLQAAYEQYTCIWKMLNTPIEYTPERDNKEAKKERADIVEEMGAKFRKLWISAFGPTKHVYLHRLVAHIPDEIRQLGDLYTRQTQGLEHSHKDRKQTLFLNSNSIPGQRRPTVLIQTIVRHATELHFDDEEVIESNKRTQQARLKRTEAKLKRLNEKAGKLETHETIGHFFNDKDLY